MRHKSNNKTRPLFTLSLKMTRLLLVPGVNSDIYGTLFVAKMWPILGPLHDLTCYYLPLVVASNEGCGS